MNVEDIIRGIIEGILLKTGDIVLIGSPGLVKKGTVVTLIIIKAVMRKVKKKSKGGDHASRGKD